MRGQVLPGNPHTHLILRGGADGPNWGPAPVHAAADRGVPVLGVCLGLVAADLFAGGVFHASQAGLIVVIVLSGALLGIVNTVLTAVGVKILGG